MRWMAGFVCFGMALIGLLGCGRVQRGEGGGQVSLASERPRIPKPKVEGSKPSPAVPTAAATTATVSPTPSSVGEKTSAPSKPPLQASSPPSPAAPLKGQPTLSVEPLPFSDEVRSVRAILESLRTQFDHLSPDEVRMRLLLAEQGLSEIEVRSPALVLWRTALRLEALQKAPTPDLTLAKAWLLRARQWLSGEGLTAIAEAEKALASNRWSEGVGALRSAAQRLRAEEQLAAIAQTRTSLLSALEALEHQKLAVAKAEVGESLKGIDRLLTALP
ncbi:MAG: hypothetical protein LKKZDAJK_000804 [Candidatus Fervidibacter sp.]